MSSYLIFIATACYFITFIDNLLQKDYPHALVWAAYAVANCGLLWHELSKE